MNRGVFGRGSASVDTDVISQQVCVQSAHLLMLSGVGDEAMLRAAGVPVLEVVLSTADDIEIRPYKGGFIAMTGDGTAEHPDLPHIGVAFMQPRARGRIKLVSPDPGVPPRIEHRYDSEPEDVAALRRGH